jgi:U4/U6 small nuclear ribonucleoprotein SNU13
MKPERKNSNLSNGEIKTEKEEIKTKNTNLEFTPFPIADLKFTSKILEALNQALKYKQIKKGINETLKMINKEQVECVIMASNSEPLELLAHIPNICEEKSIPYCFVPDSASLGRSCGIKRPVICCCIVVSDNSGMQSQIDILKDNIEMLFYS